MQIYMCQGLFSHYFHIKGDGHQPNSMGLYIPIKRIPIKGGRSPIPNIATFDHGTYGQRCYVGPVTRPGSEINPNPDG